MLLRNKEKDRSKTKWRDGAEENNKILGICFDRFQWFRRVCRSSMGSVCDARRRIIRRVGEREGGVGGGEGGGCDAMRMDERKSRISWKTSSSMTQKTKTKPGMTMMCS